jgi:hypothetical protein
MIKIILNKPKRKKCGFCLKKKKCKYGVRRWSHPLAADIERWRQERVINDLGQEVIVTGYMCEDCAILEKL